MLDPGDLGGLDQVVDAGGLGVEEDLADAAQGGGEGLGAVEDELGGPDPVRNGQFGGVGAGARTGRPAECRRAATARATRPRAPVMRVVTRGSIRSR